MVDVTTFLPDLSMAHISSMTSSGSRPKSVAKYVTQSASTARNSSRSAVACTPDRRQPDDLSRISPDLLRRVHQVRDELQLRTLEDAPERLRAGVAGPVVSNSVRRPMHTYPRESAPWSVLAALCRIGGMRLGIAHHFGWAVAVTASADHRVVDRRRIELIEPGMATAPIHHEGKPLDDAATEKLVAQVRASAMRATSASLDELASALPEPIVSMSLRAWPLDFPDDIAVQRRAPYESHADSVMYRQVLAELARARGWDVHVYDAKNVEAPGGQHPGRAGRRGAAWSSGTAGAALGQGPSDGARGDGHGAVDRTENACCILGSCVGSAYMPGQP